MSLLGNGQKRPLGLKVDPAAHRIGPLPRGPAAQENDAQRERSRTKTTAVPAGDIAPKRFIIHVAYHDYPEDAPPIGLWRPKQSATESEQSPFAPGRLTGEVQFIVTLRDLWHLSDWDTAALLGYERHEQRLVEDILNGRSTLRGRDAKDRIAALIQIRRLLHSLFRDIDEENSWLREPKPALDNRSPMELICEGSMEKLLVVRQFVEHGSGL